MPKEEEWITFAEIIVNSAAIMAELDKKGAIYSDRPVLEMGSELVGYSETLILMRYGALF